MAKLVQLRDNQVYRWDSDRLLDRYGKPHCDDVQKRLVGTTKLFGENVKDACSELTAIGKEIAARLNTAQLVLLSTNGYEHNADDQFITVDGTRESFSVTTGNLVGDIISDGRRISIGSRFGDAFLRYIVTDADGFLSVAGGGVERSDDGMSWLLPYMWSVKLREAYRLGMPKRYVKSEERLPYVRGRLDIVDYMQTPRTGRYRCHFRKLSHASAATALIARVFRLLKRSEAYRKIVSQGDMRSVCRDFLAATEGANYSDAELLSAPHFTNPFYGDYNPVIDFSKQLLHREVRDVGDANDFKSFLFDMSMLFEYFVRKALIRGGIPVADKDENSFLTIDRGLQSLERELQPDLVIENPNGRYVFDVKYKYFNTSKNPETLGGVDRSDMFQLHTYVGRYGAEKGGVQGCGFIYPVKADRWERDFGFDNSKGCGEYSGKILQHDKTIPLHVVFIKIPNNEGAEFAESMDTSKNEFVEFMSGICNVKE